MTYSTSGAASAPAYQVLDVQEAARYAAAHPPLNETVAPDADVQAREVGDGNLNLVFIVRSTAGPSAVIKQALPYVRLVGESWPLTVERNRFERQAFEVYGSIVPDLAPRIYHVDDTLALFVMEDLSRLQIVRRGLIDGRAFPRLASDVARFSAETLLRTSDFYLNGGEKKRLVALFINPELCKITEDLVLTDPFYNAASNVYEHELQPLVDRLWGDERTRDNIGRLRYAFMTRAEGLLHGDLHTGSIMASREETKILDAEFCFFGPMAFDIGMFIANLFLSAISHQMQTTAAGATYAQTMIDTAVESWSAFVDHVTALLVTAPVWQPSHRAREEYIHEILRDATGFAGAEMIRRTIGLARVAELEEIADVPTRMRAKGVALAVGRALINRYRQVDRFDEVIALVRQGIAEEAR